jgi:ribosome maturation factor RimP
VDGKRIEVPFADVEGANLVFELTPQPKKKSGQKGARTSRTSRTKQNERGDEPEETRVKR